MKNITTLILVLAASLFALPHSPYELTYAPATYSPPSLVDARDTLSNGIIVFLVPDSTLPVFDLKVRIKGGAFAEKSGEKGVASATFSLLSNGGVTGISPDSLSELLEFNAISLTSGAGNTEAVITVSCISNKIDIAMDIVEKLITSPTFDKKKLITTKANLSDAIASRFDSPKASLNILQSYGIYGKNIYTELLSEKDVKAISRSRIISFYSRVAKPENMIIAVSGKFDTKAMKIKLEELFGKLHTDKSAAIKYPTLPITSTPGFSFVDKKELSQSSVKLGLLTVQRPHKDYYSLTLMNWILGGAPFTSRISKKVREDEGLAYSAGSGISSEYFFPGVFSCYLETKSASTAYAISLVYGEIERFLADGPTDEEIASAKQSIIDAFPASFKTVALTASAFSLNQFSGDSDDRFSSFKEKINAITKDDIKRVAKSYLEKEKMTLTVVGNFEECSKEDSTKNVSLASFGKVKLLTEAELTELLGGK
jgi:zinc protease